MPCSYHHIDNYCYQLLTLLCHPCNQIYQLQQHRPFALRGAPAAICRGAKVGATKVGTNLGIEHHESPSKPMKQCEKSSNNDGQYEELL